MECYHPKSPQQHTQQRSKRVYFKQIADPDHPTRGQYGLFFAMGCSLPRTWLLDYLSPVTLGEDQDKSSNYLCNFGNHGRLAFDAFASMTSVTPDDTRTLNSTSMTIKGGN
jgi:hypothetical protein